MCGIAGFYSQTLSIDLLSMLKSLSHRGPDDVALYVDSPYSAGMTRLAINGLMDGNQPLYNENKNIVLLYNGEIYNSASLKRSLIQKGHIFSTSSDGEVICHLYEEKGLGLFAELDGMFAIALWDKQQRKLILARDHIGEKPLYYAKPYAKELIFASEIKAFQASSLSLTLNEQVIWDFPSFLWVPEPNTIYKEIQALEPGHFLICDDAGIYIQSYISSATALVPSDFTAQDIARYTSEIVTQAVKSRLMAEVPVGCFLSGGLDSSIVTALSSQAQNGIHTFSIGFENLIDPYHGNSDESQQAKFLADKLGTFHHAIHVNAQDFKDLLPQFCHFGDQPFAVSSGLGILKIAQKAKEVGVKVLLSGDGADEFFGGYSWYPYQQISRNTLHTIHEISFASIGLSLQDRAKAISQLTRQDQALAWHYYAHENEKGRLFNKNWYVDKLSSNRYFGSLNTLNDDKFPLAFLEHDRIFYFPNEMLTKVDRMCMAHSIESRVPFASKAVTDWGRSLPYSALMQQGILKVPLREGFKDLLPQEVLTRPKHGFNVPIDHWLRHSWFDLLQHTFSEQSALFKRGYIDKSSSQQALKMLNEKHKLHGHTLFCFIMLNMWLENEYNRNYC
ncbi:MAG: asparagine synthase (glutamine-hydrolyzing) [Proteobacteria bacterium]|nr:asparagine synthase (glutamine-hydrolyzing) [Pseudomonadota bacterium]